MELSTGSPQCHNFYAGFQGCILILLINKEEDYEKRKLYLL